MKVLEIVQHVDKGLYERSTIALKLKEKNKEELVLIVKFQDDDDYEETSICMLLTPEQRKQLKDFL